MSCARARVLIDDGTGKKDVECDEVKCLPTACNFVSKAPLGQISLFLVWGQLQHQLVSTTKGEIHLLSGQNIDGR